MISLDADDAEHTDGRRFILLIINNICVDLRSSSLSASHEYYFIFCSFPALQPDERGRQHILPCPSLRLSGSSLLLLPLKQGGGGLREGNEIYHHLPFCGVL